MFANYLLTALRNLARNRLYAAITIAGLAVAFAAAVGLDLRAGPGRGRGDRLADGVLAVVHRGAGEAGGGAEV